MRLIGCIVFALALLATQAFAQSVNDKSIVPGERIGPASVTMTFERLGQALGAKQGLGRPNNGQIVLQQPETAESQASAVHRFDHVGLRAVTPPGSDRVGLIAAYNSTDVDHGYTTKEGIRIGSGRAEVEAAYGKPTAITTANPSQSQMIYDDRGVGFRLTADSKVDLIQVFRPGTARERWKF